MKGWLKYPIQFLVLLVVLLYVGHYTFTYIFKKDSYYKVLYMQDLKNKQFEHFFLGNSRVLVMVDADTLSQLSQSSIYNGGVDGTNIHHHYFLLHQLLKNGNKIKNVYLSFDPWALSFTLKNNFRIWGFLPHLDDDTIYQNIKNIFKDEAWAWKYFPFWRYAEFNSRLGPVALVNSLGNFVKPNYKKSSGDIVTRNRNVLKENYSGKTDTATVRPESLTYFERILALAAKNKIRVVVYTAPVTASYKKSMFQIENVIQEQVLPIVQKYNAQYIDLSNHSIGSDLSNFYDHIHLNEKGRTQFNLLIKETLFKPNP